jgi:uncharacterized membrane protein SirB2
MERKWILRSLWFSLILIIMQIAIISKTGKWNLHPESWSSRKWNESHTIVADSCMLVTLFEIDWKIFTLVPENARADWLLEQMLHDSECICVNLGI